MATKAAFKQEEWQTLQWAVSDTMTYLSMANPGFWDMFKEASAATKFIAGVKTAGENDLIRALAADTRIKHDKELSGDSRHIADGVTKRLREAVAIVAEKAPEDLEAFKSFILGVATATANAVGGIGTSETAAIEKVKATLG